MKQALIRLIKPNFFMASPLWSVRVVLFLDFFQGNSNPGKNRPCHNKLSANRRGAEQWSAFPTFSMTAAYQQHAEKLTDLVAERLDSCFVKHFLLFLCFRVLHLEKLRPLKWFTIQNKRILLYFFLHSGVALNLLNPETSYIPHIPLWDFFCLCSIKRCCLSDSSKPPSLLPKESRSYQWNQRRLHSSLLIADLCGCGKNATQAAGRSPKVSVYSLKVLCNLFKIIHFNK